MSIAMKAITFPFKLSYDVVIYVIRVFLTLWVGLHSPRSGMPVNKEFK